MRSTAAQLIVGAGTNNTATSVAAAKALAGTPALAGGLSVVPYYVRPSEAGIVEHFKPVAAASPVPLVVYNIPYRTGRALGAKSILELAGTPNIAGLKQAVGASTSTPSRSWPAAPDGFSVLAATTPTCSRPCSWAAPGTVAASANIATERFVAMIECGLAGKLDEGRAAPRGVAAAGEGLFADPTRPSSRASSTPWARSPPPTCACP